MSIVELDRRSVRLNDKELLGLKNPSMHMEVMFEAGDVQFPDTVLLAKLYVMFEIAGYNSADWF